MILPYRINMGMSALVEDGRPPPPGAYPQVTPAPVRDASTSTRPEPSRTNAHAHPAQRVSMPLSQPEAAGHATL